MRVLIDGQYGDHNKKLYTIDSSVPNYNIYEKYLVAHDTDTDEQPTWLNYRTRSTSVDSFAPTDMTQGIRYTTNGNFPIFGSGMTLKSYNIAGATGSGYKVEVQMSSKPNLIYDNTKLRTGFVSALTYQVGANTVLLPSVGRGLTTADGTATLNEYEVVRNYFSDTYTIGKTTSTTGATTLASTISNIAIIGLVNNYNTNTTDLDGKKKNVNVEGELKRTTLITNIKQNVAAVSRGMGPKTATSGKRWCAGGTFSSFSSSEFDNCTTEVHGEKIVFIDGNTIIKCSSGSDTNTCMVNDKRAIIVKNGSLYLKSNISTLTTSQGVTNGQIFLGVMNDTGLANVTVNPDDVNIAAENMRGWLFVDPRITNIDAFLFAQGPLVSYNEEDIVNGENIFYSRSNTTEQKLRNQLGVYGSILTLNTITGSRQAIPECPYNIDNCNDDIAQIFDFVYTRRFVTGPASLCAPYDEADTRIVPYHPMSPDLAKWIGGKTGAFTASTNELRYITDPEYRPYPMVIERDLRWNSSPSRLFQVNR